ncbi:MAG: biotin-dependent carboxyltransferase family protein [Pseudonocardia sp.]
MLRTGPLTLVTDLGRPGLSHLGVPRSGALDAPALRLANRLVGNPEDRAGLEVLLGGLELRAEAGCTLAVTGAPTAVTLHRVGGARTDGGGHAVGSHRTVHLRAGERLVVSAPGGGLRNYVAVAGGVDVTPVLGSRSSDLLSGLGPAPLRAGDRLPVGPAPDQPADAGPVPVSVPADTITVPIVLGPRDAWLDRPAEALRRTRWTVDPASNRIGLRLRGGALRRHPDRADHELPSEPVCPGAVQVPPGGQPVVFLADGPTTGGYPVVGLVEQEWLAGLAQVRPGSVVRLLPTSA